MTIRHRDFPDYDAYVYAQGGKARSKRAQLLAALPRDIKAFRRVFDQADRYLLRGPILCIGARSGAEVTAAIECGFKGSQGLDLHPVGKNVRQGDWHSMPFADASFANVFSNSLDHCLSLDKLATEVRRVLVDDGVFYVRASDRDPGKTLETWIAKGGNEALYWQTADDLRDALLERGFVKVASWRDRIWGCYVIRRART